MREILFTGKRKDSGEWVYGSLIIDTLGRYYIHPIDEYLMIDICKGSRNKHYIVDYDVVPETVSQFTGYCDKNGTKIFEGDILGIQYDDLYPEDITKCAVVFHDGAWCLEDLYYNKLTDQLEAFDTQRGEVVGNIFDNIEVDGK